MANFVFYNSRPEINVDTSSTSLASVPIVFNDIMSHACVKIPLYTEMIKSMPESLKNLNIKMECILV